MPIHRVCEQCHKGYTVPPARAAKTRFCSRACRNANDRTAERRELVCEECGTKFTTVQDHGVWPKFCSRECFLSQCVQPEDKPCATCGGMFLAGKAHHESDDGLRKYCSKKCRDEGLKRGDEYHCLNCNATFYLSPATLRQRTHAGCCSQECKTAYYTGSRSAGFKGGFYTHTQSREKHLLLARPGYVGKYIGEHRVVASRAIGRLIRRGEYVIRLNRNPNDNRPENLFICESNSEFCRRRNGSLPWPRKSNLGDYAAKTPNAELRGRPLADGPA